MTYLTFELLMDGRKWIVHFLQLSLATVAQSSNPGFQYKEEWVGEDGEK
jgi:hypothetical protein